MWGYVAVAQAVARAVCSKARKTSGQVDVYCCVLLFVPFGPWLSDKGCKTLKPVAEPGSAQNYFIYLFQGLLSFLHLLLGV